MVDDLMSSDGLFITHRGTSRSIDLGIVTFLSVADDHEPFRSVSCLVGNAEDNRPEGIIELLSVLRFDLNAEPVLDALDLRTNTSVSPLQVPATITRRYASSKSVALTNSSISSVDSNLSSAMDRFSRSVWYESGKYPSCLTFTSST